MKKLYLETSIISYLTARPPRDIIGAARQQITIDWWEQRRKDFDLYVSSIVEDEAAKGDLDAAARRLDVIRKIPRLSVSKEANIFAKRLIEQSALPETAIDDALHIAIASVHRIDYLLTWNCRHIDNAQTKPLMRYLCIEAGLSFPEICTPEELMEDIHNVG